ncbi:MAG TPA: VanW family protein [Polyangiaceae bacterium]|nr:VanW family protein [Polyangiaceae bacterium]
MRSGLLAAAFALGGIAAAAVLFGPRAYRLLCERPAVVVGDERLDADTDPRELLKRVALRVGEREAYLAAPEGNERTSFAELGVELDSDATLVALLHAMPVRSVGERLKSLFAVEPEPPVVPLAYQVDEERAREFLGALGRRLHRTPENARLDLRGHRRVREATGRDLDVGATLRAVEDGERDDLARFELSFVPLEPGVTQAELASVDVSRVLSSFETDFSKKPRSRVPNIRTAAGYLNGVIIGPGDVFSFNHVVGPRTEERGFVNAPVIVQDELEPGLGGGVCQVASTLFAAAMLGGLEIVERRSHSRPSGYAPLGLDATVIYPEVDLRLRNPYSSPLMLHAFLPSRGVLRVELLGRDPPGKIEHFFAAEAPQPFTRRVVVKSDLLPGTIDRRQKGNAGYDGTSTLLTIFADGTRKARTYSSKYYPVPEVYWVAEGVDLASLPPLPEGAVGVEVSTEGDPVDGERGDSREP